jgi:hypothetical protein
MRYVVQIKKKDPTKAAKWRPVILSYE